MPKHYAILVLILFFSSERDLFGQKKSDLAPEIIVNTFIRKIGGEKWLDLKSRKEFARVEYEEDKDSIIPIKDYDRIKVNLNPGNSIETHEFIDRKTTLVFKTECNWYYSTRSQVIKFFGPEPIKFKQTFPRTELMEVLNLEPINKVYIEDTLYRVDFKDARQLDGKQSLFFGMVSGLLYKRGYKSKNDVHWEFHFSNYTELQGFSEPHQVKLTSNGKDFLTISIKSILYDVDVDPHIFNPPIPCRNKDDFKRLEFPYFIDLK
jgi:hypothetical protein